MRGLSDKAGLGRGGAGGGAGAATAADCMADAGYRVLLIDLASMKPHPLGEEVITLAW